MKKFRFKFRALKDKRLRAEESAKRNHGIAQRRVFEIEQQILEKGEMISDTLEKSSGRMESSLNIDRLIQERRWKLTLESELSRLRERLAQAVKFAETTRQALVKASRDHQVMIRLEERHQEAWQREWLRREQADIDEVALQVVRGRR
jgi:flagellar export protein FliJ